MQHERAGHHGALCDGQRFATQIENFDRRNSFRTTDYPLPEELTRTKHPTERVIL